MDFTGKMREISGKINDFADSGRSLSGIASGVLGLGAKIGSAAMQAKANRLALRAANQQNAAAREMMADAANPLNNVATQAALNAGEQQIAEQQRAAEKQNVVMGATPEMQLAQRQQGLQTLANMYATASNGAYNNYMEAQKAADAAAINPLMARQQSALSIASGLNTAGDNLFKSSNRAAGSVK